MTDTTPRTKDVPASATPADVPPPVAPTGRGPLARGEARLAWGMLFPTLAIVAAVVLLPLLAIFWISVKPVQLSDLRAPELVLREDLRRIDAPGEEGTWRFRLRNSSPDRALRDVSFTDLLPPGLDLGTLPEACAAEAGQLTCTFGDVPGGWRETLVIPATASATFEADLRVQDSAPVLSFAASSVLTDGTFTLDNFARIFSSAEFVDVLWATIFYTVVGTVGAIVMGLFAALLLDASFKGRGILRGLYLFPYVAPVIAVAFAWIILFDPFSGSANALLIRMGVTDEAINFFGERPLALIMVTLFEIWRYFPLSFLFILARMQSVPSDMFEAAEMDGASPFQQFRWLMLPQLAGILGVLFLLRFIWTFNKFDDIFLLTGGNAGTRTLTVSVYEQAFAISNIGAGAAVAVVIFACLLAFSALFFRVMSREEGL
ncbi:sugar ABC transporter permease [Jannaschia aquimarina]|uniref:YcjO_1 protein n=1 Tax=Jannaschia aquimarina TaxID=935700 RepID=A0A0D1CRL1_9RHOB|nr:sugar ABC transporter permease [Jannaschia aquimarina]KIT17417.1 Inner membrane ABC transporter permease protein YcjO [Jannaschia aquimarina]SNT24155.1 carbohydrate ABC transporter membrane protein 1, CUT1 family [Jannaschia aquimarina]